MRSTKQTLSKLWLFYLLIIYSSFSYSATAVLNEGFEDAVLAPWYQGGGTLDYPHDEFWNITSNRSFSGSYSVTNVGNNELRQDFSPIDTNQISEISFYLLRETYAVESGIQLYYDDGSYNLVIVSNTDIDTWEHMDVTSYLELNKNLSGISVFGIRSGDPGGLRVYMDDMSIVAVPAVPLPASTWLFSSVLLGLIGAFRIKTLGDN